MKTNSVPVGDIAGFRHYFRQDFLAGFLVFLIALPLCLGISLASGYPPLAGIFTAIIGSILATFISNSELTIKGPAAGLIVIALGCIQDFGGDGALGGFGAADLRAYRAALAVGVAAAVLQIVFGLLRAGILGEFFPSVAVHGMLAAIGVIIIAKQLPVVLGVSAKGEPLELLKDIPQFVLEANPAIALIGGISLLIMFVWPVAGKKLGPLKAIPSPMVVLLFAIPMGLGFNLLESHDYLFQGHQYPLGEQFLVDMPDKIFGMFAAITMPDFSALQSAKAWKWVLMFFAIGSIESMLSAKAVELLDPHKRHTNLNRDMLAVGVSNLCCSLVGGLPMISEIVRSRANIDNGAQTRFANFWHGMLLLFCVALIPMGLHLIPLAALAAMLVYTGYRLAHPKEMVHVYSIGREQLIIFLTTLIAVLATDLLIGIAIGISLKLMIHLANGVPLKSLFKPYLYVQQLEPKLCYICAYESAVFSNWIPFRRQLEDIGLVQKQNIRLDLANVKLVDHSVLEKLQEMQQIFEQEDLQLEVVGLDHLSPVSSHLLATRKAVLFSMRRISVAADPLLQDRLEALFIEHGANGYTLIPCQGLGPHAFANGAEIGEQTPQLWYELIVSEVNCERILNALKLSILPQDRILISVAKVEVLDQSTLSVASLSRQLVEH